MLYLFDNLARSQPKLLIALIESGCMDYYDLTYAAESAGRVEDPSIVVPTLLNLLDHSNAVVREGAIYGLSMHLDGVMRTMIRERLEIVIRDDGSESVKIAAASAIDRDM